MTEHWSHEPIEIEEMPGETPSRYTLPKAFVKARRSLNPNQRAVVEELAERYRKAADERPVAITMRQLAGACNMTRMGVQRALTALVEKGFIAVFERGSYEGKRKPSRYRLTFYPCGGNDATNDYIEDPKQWRRAGKRKPPTTLPPFAKVTVPVPMSHLVDVVDAVKRALPRAAA